MPDVAVVDIGLPGMSGLEGITALKARCRNLRVLTLTVYDYDEEIFEARCAGATACLLKKTSPDRLLAGLAEAVSGERRCRPRWRGAWWTCSASSGRRPKPTAS